MTKRTAFEKLEKIDQLFRQLDQGHAELKDIAHVPRKEPLARGVARTVLNDCDPSCARCGREKKLFKQQARLAKIQRAALAENARDDYRNKMRIRERQSERAKKKRTQRKPSLSQRGLNCVLEEYPDIKAAGLLDQLPLTYDDDDIELRLEGDNNIVIEDLRTHQTKNVNKSHLRQYLWRGRRNT